METATQPRKRTTWGVNLKEAPQVSTEFMTVSIYMTKFYLKESDSTIKTTPNESSGAMMMSMLRWILARFTHHKKQYGRQPRGGSGNSMYASHPRI